LTQALDTIANKHSRRMSLHRQMMKHLDIKLDESAALEHYDQIRATVLACAVCPDSGYCADWISAGRNGAPSCCKARATFQALMLACQETDDDVRPKLRLVAGGR